MTYIIQDASQWAEQEKQQKKSEFESFIILHWKVIWQRFDKDSVEKLKDSSTRNFVKLNQYFRIRYIFFTIIF